MSPASVPQGLDAAGEDNGARFAGARRGPISGVLRAARAINFCGMSQTQIPQAASQGALSRTTGAKVALDGRTHGRAIERAGRGSAPDRPADYPSRVEDHARSLV
jgi:hypothetical protein